MPTLGKKRDMLMDTTVSKPPPTTASNTSIKEDEIFDKKPVQQKMTLEVQNLGETPTETTKAPVDTPTKARGKIFGNQT